MECRFAIQATQAAMPLQASQSRLMVLMFTDIVGSVDLKQRMGDAEAAALIRRHDDLFAYTTHAFAFTEILKDLGDGFLAALRSASDAVHARRCAFSARPACRRVARRTPQGAHRPAPWRSFELDDGQGDGQSKISGLAVDIASRVMSLATARADYDDPPGIRQREAVCARARAHRQAKRPAQCANGSRTGRTSSRAPMSRWRFSRWVKWVWHHWRFHPTPTRPRAVAADQEETLGWRPAVGMEVPERKNWVIEPARGRRFRGGVAGGECADTRSPCDEVLL